MASADSVTDERSQVIAMRSKAARRHVPLIGAAAALGVLLGIAGFADSASAAFPSPPDPAAYYVSAAGICPSGVPPASCFTTVTAAIDANNALPAGGTTVLVDDGVYTGSFRILKPVTLRGTSKAAVIQTEYTAPGPRGIWVESSNVTIENLTIKGYAEPAGVPGEDASVCIYVVPYDPPFHPIDPSSYLDNIKILDNDIQPGFFADDPSANSGQGVATAITNIVDPTQPGAVYITDLTISGNTFHPVDAETGADRAIVVNPGVADSLISDNTVTGKYLSGSLFSGLDGNVEVSGNRFDGIAPFSLANSWGFYDSRWGHVKVVGNEFSGATKYPIQIDYSSILPAITENTFTDIMSGAAAPLGNIAIHQFLGTDDPFYSQYDPYDPALSTRPVGEYFHDTPYVYGQPERLDDYAGTGDGHYVDYIPATYRVEYYRDSITPGNELGTAAAGLAFLTDAIEPLAEGTVTTDLGGGWIDARRPSGYGAGVATYPGATPVIADNVVRVLYLAAVPTPTPEPTSEGGALAPTGGVPAYPALAAAGLLVAGGAMALLDARRRRRTHGQRP